MFQTVQTISIWLTTAILFVTTGCPSLMRDCACPQGDFVCCSTGCCCGTSGASNACRHCQEETVELRDDEFVISESLCHCGHQAPMPPTQPGVPASPNTFSLSDWIGANVACFIATPLPSPVPAHAQVPTGEILMSSFTQVAYGVWLI